MRIPGFTAESSLYARNGTLRSRGLVSVGGRSIIPQLMPIGGLGGFGANCYSVGEDIVCYETEGGSGIPGIGSDYSGKGADRGGSTCFSGNELQLCFCNSQCSASETRCKCFE